MRHSSILPPATDSSVRLPLSRQLNAPASQNEGSQNAGSQNAASQNAASQNAGSQNAGSQNAGSGQPPLRTEPVSCPLVARTSQTTVRSPVPHACCPGYT